MAFVLLKYLPLSDLPTLRHALDVLQTALASELWSERAAALVFVQYMFWSHAFLLQRQDWARLQVGDSLACFCCRSVCF